MEKKTTKSRGLKMKPRKVSNMDPSGRKCTVTLTDTVKLLPLSSLFLNCNQVQSLQRIMAHSFLQQHSANTKLSDSRCGSSLPQYNMTEEKLSIIFRMMHLRRGKIFLKNF